ncbi:MAG: alpha-amylase family glycosyl hydrolase [Steroidobacteraceae bacterium]
MPRLACFLLAIVLGLTAAAALADVGIERVEPASWWVGMKSARLQLLVHGEEIATLEPAIDDPRVSIARVLRTENPNYLFIDLAIAPDAAPGLLDIAFRRGSRTVLRHAYPLLARDPDSAERKGFGPADAIYLAMPDRFANGDTENDSVAGYRQGFDRADPDGRHGGDLEGLRQRLGYLAGLGFTQLWLNPVQQNDQPQASYHGYAITDFYRIDDRLGDNALYRSLVAEARRHGIGVIMDIVLNHCGSEHWWMKDLPDPDWINHGGSFAGTTHRRETLTDPHAANADRAAFTDGWFVPAMPDLNQRHPLLATYLIQNTIWWIEYAGLSGLRLDTLPYADRNFLESWYVRVLEEYPALTIVGEEWSVDPALVARWQPASPADQSAPRPPPPSLMDFPLQDALLRGLTEREGPETGLLRIYQTLARDFLYADAGRLVVFPDNHDMSHIRTLLGDDLALTQMAIAFFATVRGIPQFTWGTEILMANPGTEAHGLIRQDFPGGWPGDATNAFSGVGLAADVLAMQNYVRRLLQWRKDASAIHGGRLTQYAPREDAYVFFRQDNRQTVLVALNKADAERRIDTARFAESIGDSSRARDVLAGREFALGSTLVLPARSATILELTGAASIPPGVTGTLRTHAEFGSRHVDARRVDVWLPPGYESDAASRYPVIYMHDGQNLFDPALSYIGVDWGMDEAMTRLIAEGKVPAAIVVGVWNTPKRFAEYMPQRAVTETRLPDDWPDMAWIRKQRIESDGYLRFLVEELKPFIDSTYRTLPGRGDTSIMGSSMGALISFYAVAERPDIFGGAGCVSIHWPLGDGLVIDYLARHLPKPGSNRFYFDFGTATLDQSYEPYQRRVDALMRAAGYVEGRDWLTRKYEGAEHSERAWRARVEVPLRFLLGQPRNQNR